MPLQAACKIWSACRAMASSSKRPGKPSFRSNISTRPGQPSNPQFARIDGLGRTMTRILRHQAGELNLKLRSDGYCKVKELLALSIKTRAGFPLKSHTVEEVLKAVEQDNKQRFSLTDEDGELYIRANQGHSIKEVLTEDLLREIKAAAEVPVCVHGTYKEALPSIIKTGLKVMRRNHIHFATGLPAEGGVISGMRSSCQVLIY